MRLIENYCQQARDLIAKSLFIINNAVRAAKRFDAVVIIEVRKNTRTDLEWVFYEGLEYQ
jgi:hypothetical protein